NSVRHFDATYSLQMASKWRTELAWAKPWRAISGLFTRRLRRREGPCGRLRRRSPAVAFANQQTAVHRRRRLRVQAAQLQPTRIPHVDPACVSDLPSAYRMTTHEQPRRRLRPTLAQGRGRGAHLRCDEPLLRARLDPLHTASVPALHLDRRLPRLP